MRSKGYAVQDVQKRQGQKKLLKVRGHENEIRGLEDEARQIGVEDQRTRGPVDLQTRTSEDRHSPVNKKTLKTMGPVV